MKTSVGNDHQSLEAAEHTGRLKEEAKQCTSPILSAAASRDLDKVGVNGGIDIVLISKRTQPFSPSAFTSVGIDPAARRYVVVKSMNHFRAGFEPIAKAIVYAAAPGAIDFDYRRIPYTRLRRPIYPLDADAWAG